MSEQLQPVIVAPHRQTSYRKVMQKPNRAVSGFEMWVTVWIDGGREIFLGMPTREELANVFREVAEREPDQSHFQHCVLVQRQP